MLFIKQAKVHLNGRQISKHLLQQRETVLRALDHPILGPKFGSFLMQKSFSQYQTKNSNLTQNLFFSWVGGYLSLFHMKQILYRTYFYIFTISQNNRIQSHLLLSLPFSEYTKASLIIGINLAMGTSCIMTMSNFPILVITPLIFPIPWTQKEV